VGGESRVKSTGFGERGEFHKKKGLRKVTNRWWRKVEKGLYHSLTNGALVPGIDHCRAYRMKRRGRRVRREVVCQGARRVNW